MKFLNYNNKNNINNNNNNNNNNVCIKMWCSHKPLKYS